MEIKVHGLYDRMGSLIPKGVVSWTIRKSDLIVDSRMTAVVAEGVDVTGSRFWLAGPMDMIGRPGHARPPLQAEEMMLWKTLDYAEENHKERVIGDVR